MRGPAAPGRSDSRRHGDSTSPSPQGPPPCPGAATASPALTFSHQQDPHVLLHGPAPWPRRGAAHIGLSGGSGAAAAYGPLTPRPPPPAPPPPRRGAGRLRRLARDRPGSGGRAPACGCAGRSAPRAALRRFAPPKGRGREGGRGEGGELRKRKPGAGGCPAASCPRGHDPGCSQLPPSSYFFVVAPAFPSPALLQGCSGG